MKVGDKLICIRTVRLCFMKDEIYTVTKVYEDSYVVFGYEFYIKSRVNAHYDFDKYFISLKEMRQDKLKKLNDKILDS